MTPIPTLLNGPPYPDLLNSWQGWLGWCILLGSVVAGVLRWRGMQKHDRLRGWLLALFLLMVPLTNLFLGMRLSSGTALPPSGIPAGPHNPVWMIFSALPWMLAGGILGPLGALIVGAFTGLTRCLWDTHNLFTILEPAMLAVLFSAAILQRYRSLFYRLMRLPLLVGAGLVPVYALIFLFSSLFSVSGGLAARVDFALTNLGPAVLATGGELLVAGLFVQIIAIALPGTWGRQEPLQPSPAELSLQTRILSSGGTFIAILLISVVLGDWIVAGNAARRMIRDRLAGTAQTTAAGVPFFLETGQNLITQLAGEPSLLGKSGQQLSSFLGDQMHTVPYFDQLYVIDLKGKLLAAYPAGDAASFGLAQAETSGVALALKGVPAQSYSLSPAAGETAARLSFIAAILNENRETQRVLIGRSQLINNPFFQPLIQNLKGIQSLGGDGKLLDDQGRVLYSPNPDELMNVYNGQKGQQAQFYDTPSPGGLRYLAYYQPVEGSSWAVVLLVPAEQAQQLALNIATPLVILVLALAIVSLVSLRLSLRVLTASLQGLATEAGRIAQGKLDQPLGGGGVDEVGQLRRAFEQMRVSMHARLEELNQLLLVSQGVASTLEMEGAVQPILEAVLASGASAVRVALMPTAQPQEGDPLTFALGPGKDLYAPLDETILTQAQKQGRLVYDNLNRLHSLDLPEGLPHPEALVAVSLFHEKRYYGVLWAAFDQPHVFTEEDLRFLSTLAGQAALAAANARLFRTAEVGRQRLAAILASTPDPVLVTDQENRLILANPAAKRALGVVAGPAEGQPTEHVIGQKELRELLQELESGKTSAEVAMPDSKTYFATASAVIADGRSVGRVCVMQDVTHFKELDSLKSDFVSSVSHDLRSPLTLMRGYTTMLGMVGELNEQQQGYVSKIGVGVESMGRLVSNLLDLGRLGAGAGVQVEKVAPQEVVDAAVKTLQLLADQKGIQLEVQGGSDLPQAIDADRALLQQGIYNLVENAIKYTPKNGKVTVRMKPLPGSVLFEICDTGIGISPADQPRLFEKFFRGSQREARAERGSGLGLAIVRSIAERHGGKVWVESVLGQGSTFFLLIPTVHLDAGRKKA
jgi:PAS domain S-box-containing protein